MPTAADSSGKQRDTSADQAASLPPLRPDGSFRHPLYDQQTHVDPNGSVRVYYRRDRPNHTTITTHHHSSAPTPTPTQQHQSGTATMTAADSGHGSLSNRRSTTPGTTFNTLTSTTSPYSTLGKSTGEQAAVDLLHDKWADLMDRYLDNKFRSASVGATHNHNTQHSVNFSDTLTTTNNNNNQDLNQSATSSTSQKRSHVIRLNDPNATLNASSTIKRSRCQSPNDGGGGSSSFSYLYSGREDLPLSAHSTLHRQSTSPYAQQQMYYNRGSPVTQSQRYPSPHLSVTSPTRSSTLNKQPATKQPQSQGQQQQQQQQPPIDDTSKNLLFFKALIHLNYKKRRDK